MSKISSRERALPGFSIKTRMMEYSTWVSLMRWPFFSRVRFRVFSRKGGWLSSPVACGGSPPPERRIRASTRAVSSAGEKGLVT